MNKLAWKPDEFGGYVADAGIVELAIEPADDDGNKGGQCVARVSWRGDDEKEWCATVEEAKAEAKRLAIAHLRACIAEVEALS